MLKKMLWTAVVALLWVSSVCAQDIVGDWEGTLKGRNNPRRLLLRISKTDNGDLTGIMYIIDDDAGDGVPTSRISIQGSDIKFTLEAARASYEGKTSSDGCQSLGRGLLRIRRSY